MGGFVGLFGSDSLEANFESGAPSSLPGNRGTQKHFELEFLTGAMSIRHDEADLAEDRSLLVGVYGYLPACAPGEVSQGCPTARPSATDRGAAQLLRLFAVLHGGAFTRLRGQWSAFVYEKAVGRLTLARDFLGSRPLFFSDEIGGVRFATEPAPLLSLSRLRPSLSTSFLRGFLNGSMAPAGSPFARISRVPPGSFLQFQLRDGSAYKVADETFWRPPVECGELQGSDRRYELRRRVWTAVERALPASGGVLITLSGGLDSSAVLSAAAALTKDGGSSCDIAALSLRFKRLPGCEEGPAIEAVSQFLGVRRTDVLVDSPLTTDDLADLYSRTDVPVHINSPLFAKLARSATKLGQRIVLTGHGGDHFLDGDPWALDDLIQMRDFQAAGELATSLWLNGTVSSLRIARRIFDPWLWTKRSLLRRLGGDQADEVGEGRETRVLLENLLDEQASTLMDGSAQVAESEGIEFRDPLLDQDLVEHAFRLRPGALMTSGRFRGLLRCALEGRLPTAVLDRDDKAEFSSFSTPLTREWAERERGGILLQFLRVGILSADEVQRVLDPCPSRSRVLRGNTVSLGEFWRAVNSRMSQWRPFASRT